MGAILELGRRITIAACALLVMLLATGPQACASEPTDSQHDKPDRTQRMEWFRDAKFGMFIHWGIYSVPAGEWNGKTNYAEWIMLQANIPFDQYTAFASKFDPTRFNAKQWVKVAKDAGMKYIVITAKHHDGFCMFDTKLTDYNIVKATPFKRDPLKELAVACRDAGLRLCFYYSVPDWHHPEFPAKYSQHGYHGNPNPDADIDKYVAYVKGQLRELLTNYGPIGIIWFDGGGSFKETGNRAEVMHAQEIIDMIHRLQPQCLVNNRLGVPADYGTPEQKIPGQLAAEPFEVCMTLNRHWGYNSHDDDWKTPESVIFNLADIVSKGGNYLLNVGPTAEGVIPQRGQAVLRAVGDWLRINGDAIYGAGPTPFGEELGRISETAKDKAGKPLFVAKTGWRCTTRPGKLYIHIAKWPNGELALPPVRSRITRAYLLADPNRQPCAVAQTAAGVSITLPAEAPEGAIPVLCIELAAEAAAR